MTANEIGHQLVEMCRAGDFTGAIEKLYSPRISSHEPVGDEKMPADAEGIEAIRGKNEWWVANHEVHGCVVEGPYPHGERFAVTFDLDVTPAVGPGAGQRIQMREVALYTVAGGKIVREEFFYQTGG